MGRQMFLPVLLVCFDLWNANWCAIGFDGGMDEGEALIRSWDIFEKEKNGDVGGKVDGGEVLNLFDLRGTLLDHIFETGENLKQKSVHSVRRCERYCIERDANQNIDDIRKIYLFWSNKSDTFPAADFLSINISEFKSIYGKPSNLFSSCPISFDLNCKIAKMETNESDNEKEFHAALKYDLKNDENDDRLYSTSDVSIKLAEQYSVSGSSETKFLVNNFVSRIVINISGKLATAILELPSNTTVWETGMTITLSSRRDAEGVRIEASNAPPGGWRIKLRGVENLKYSLNVEAEVRKGDDDPLLIPRSGMSEESSQGKMPSAAEIAKLRKTDINEDVLFTDKEFDEIVPKMMINREEDWSSVLNSQLSQNAKMIFERSLETSKHQGEGGGIIFENPFHENINKKENPVSQDTFISYIKSNFENDSNNLPRSENLANFAEVPENKAKILTRSSIASVEDVDMDVKIATINNANISMRMIEELDDQGISDELSKYINEDSVERGKMLIELNKNSDLIVRPGTRHRVLFDAVNKCVLPVRYVFAARSSPFTVYNIQPVFTWIYPGQTGHVAIDLIVPTNTAPNTINTLTVSVVGTQIKEKSVYLYSGNSGSEINDDVKPSIRYSFNNNCAGKADKDRCTKSSWSVDVTIEDPDSGLKRVVSSINEIYPRTDFVSGTRRPVTFYYSSTCCDTSVKITATDLLNNQNTITIDVTEWDNLSGAEIAAITLGTLLVILLIIFVILLIIYCVRRKKGHDLPYTQRYGSRSPPQAERTSF